MLLQIRKIDVLPLAKLLTLFFPVALIYGTAYGDIVGSLVAGLFLLHSLLKNDWSFLRHKWVQLGCALWAFQLVSTLWAADKWLAFVSAAGWGRFLLLGVALAFWVLHERAMLRKFFVMIVLCVAFLSIDGLFQYQTGSDLLGHIKYNQYANVDDYGNPKVGDRLTGPYNKPILGAVMVYLLFPVVLCGIYAPSLRRKFLYSAIALGAMLVVLLSGERSQLLLLVLGLGLVALQLLRTRRIGALLLAASIVAALVGLEISVLEKYNPAGKHYIEDRQVASTLSVISNFKNSPYGLIWRDALLLIEKHPLLGVGEGNIRVHWCQLKEQVHFTAGCPLHPHNVYLEMLANTGLIGCGLYLLTLLFIMRHFYIHRALWKNDPLIVGIFITLCVRMWPFITVTSYMRAPGSQTLWMMVGWGVALIACRLREISQDKT